MENAAPLLAEARRLKVPAYEHLPPSTSKHVWIMTKLHLQLGRSIFLLEDLWQL